MCGFVIDLLLGTKNQNQFECYNPVWNEGEILLPKSKAMHVGTPT